MSENSNQNSVVSVRVVEIIVALMFLVVGLVVMTGSIKLGAKWVVMVPSLATSRSILV